MSELDYIKDIQTIFIADPMLQHKRKFSASEASGACELSARRGEHNVIYKCYKVLRREHTEAAKYLLTRFRMKPNGNIEL